MDIHEIVAQIEPEINDIRNIIHENPELGLKEFKTSALVEKELREKTHVDSIQHIGDTGLLVELKGTKEGPAKCIALRGDMDALPIQEAEGMSPRSKVNGVMHACGHDVHTSILLGAVRTLEHYRDQIQGSILFFFQPAEEILAGGKMYANSPLIDFSKIDGVAALHVSPEIDAGTIGVRYGAILASSDFLNITIKGKGGHGAHPHTVVDPIVISAAVINELQTMRSREISTFEPFVLSICTIHGGDKSNNIVPDEVKMTGTIRTVNPEVRAYVNKRIPEIVKNVAESMRGEAEVEIELGPPPFVSDDEWVDRVIRCGSKLLGEENVIQMKIPSMGAEDFAYVKEKAKGVFVRFGARTPGGPYGSMHSSTFYCDRKAITTGILTLSGIALDFFGAEY